MSRTLSGWTLVGIALVVLIAYVHASLTAITDCILDKHPLGQRSDVSVVRDPRPQMALDATP